MFIHDAPYLGSLNGGARLRDSAVRLQHYLDVNPANQARAVEFWKDQKALGAKPNGHPADGLFIGTGVRDIRIDCYTVLSAVRMGSAPDKALWDTFCNAFILANGGSITPLAFTKDITGSNASDAAATYIPNGTPYSNNVAVAGGKAPYTYQWYVRKSGANTPVGSNQNSYSILAYAVGNNGDYFVEVTDAEGTKITSKSDRTRVAVRLTTNIPASATWTVGGPGVLTVVAADGLAPLTYQWFKNDVAMPGASTSATLTVSSTITAEAAGTYHCVVTSANTKAPRTVSSVKCLVVVEE